MTGRVSSSRTAEERATRVRCEWCGYKVRAVNTGKPGVHRLYVGDERYLCPGSWWFPHGDPIADWLTNPYAEAPRG